MSLPAAPTSVRTARELVAEVAETLGAPRRVIDDVRLCVSEAATNVVRHAYSGSAGELRIDVERDDGELAILVCDDGVGLDRFKQEGELGHGLRIMERLSNRFVVKSVPNGGTEVHMVFALDR